MGFLGDNHYIEQREGYLWIGILLQQL